MDRLALVELIEDQGARLTPEGRDHAQRMELLAEAPPSGRAATYERQRAQTDDAWDLPLLDRNILERLLMLREGLERAEGAERLGEPGGRHLDLAVTGAAGLKDRYEARMIDPDMSPEQAAARLREPE